MVSAALAPFGWIDPVIEDRVLLEPDNEEAYRAALFLIFTGRDVREVEAAVAKRENMAMAAASLIRNAGLRQADVAARAKVDRAVVSRVCTGGKVAYKAQLAVWSAALAMKREQEERA